MRFRREQRDRHRNRPLRPADRRQVSPARGIRIAAGTGAFAAGLLKRMLGLPTGFVAVALDAAQDMRRAVQHPRKKVLRAVGEIRSPLASGWGGSLAAQSSCAPEYRGCAVTRLPGCRRSASPPSPAPRASCTCRGRVRRKPSACVCRPPRRVASAPSAPSRPRASSG